MQQIAEENNQAETAFYIPKGDDFHIRWFTPTKEVKLCGHATLATAHVLFNEYGYERDEVIFDSLSGALSVSRNNGLLTLDFPSQPPVICETPELLRRGLGIEPVECYQSMDFLVVVENGQLLKAIEPDYNLLKQVDLRGVIVVAPGELDDLWVRFFAPKAGIPEDSVTGSAYTQIMPYWYVQTGNSKLNARQVSSRSGKVYCELVGDRVKISGSAVKYLAGTIDVLS